jgi:LuxR family transcriptional regulator, activator of conjugal transfer of Ti plasmids
LRPQLIRLIDSLEVSEDEKSIEHVLQQFANACDIEHFAYLSLSDSDSYAVTNYPKNWQEHYFERNYMRIDPVVTSAKRMRRTFSWSSDQRRMSDPDEKRFFGEAAEFGLRSGLSFPARLAFGRLGMLTFASHTNKMKLDFDDYAFEMAVAVTTIHMNLKRGSSLAARRRSIDLSPRQAECLEWASRGKTASTTATILGISESSVAFYLKEARAKLNADNLPHAVRVAMEANIIV